MTDTISPEAIKAIDKLYFTTAQRASGVLSLLNDIRDYLRKQNRNNKRALDWDVPSDWDIFCFAAEYVGQKALEFGDDELLAIAVALGRWLNGAHYSNPHRLYGEPEIKPKLEVMEEEGEE